MYVFDDGIRGSRGHLIKFVFMFEWFRCVSCPRQRVASGSVYILDGQVLWLGEFIG